MIHLKTLERLHNSSEFLQFLEYLAQSRERYIACMHEASTEAIQQISGRILAIDEVLQLGEYEKLKSNWERLLASQPQEKA